MDITKCSFLTAFILLQTNVVYLINGEKSFDCPLSWKALAFSDPLPSDVVFITATLQSVGLISRVIAGQTFNNGRVQGGIAYILSDSDVPSSLTSEYEVLTNPYGCTLKWVQGTSPLHQATYSATGPPIGRAFIAGNMRAGPVKNGRMFSVISSNPLGIESTANFETLTSFSPGLSLEITDFVYLNDIDVAEEQLGVDDIHNHGPSELLQTVTVKQRIFNSVSFSFSSMSSSTHGVKLSASVGLPLKVGNGGSIGFGGSLDLAWTNGRDVAISKHHSKESMVEVTREVIVQPYTSVTVCSTIQMATDFAVDFVAKGRYFAPGVQASTVRAVLEGEGAVIIGQEGDTIITQQGGRIGGKMGLSTKFIVVPYDNVDGCSSLAGRKAVSRHAK